MYSHMYFTVSEYRNPMGSIDMGELLSNSAQGQRLWQENLRVCGTDKVWKQLKREQIRAWHGARWDA